MPEPDLLISKVFFFIIFCCLLSEDLGYLYMTLYREIEHVFNAKVLLYQVLLSAHDIVSQYTIIFMRYDLAYGVIKPLQYDNVSTLFSLTL